MLTTLSKWALVCAGITGTSIFLGAMFGRANSPSYDSTLSGFIYFAANVKYVPVDDQDFELRLAAGPILYRYRHLTKTMKKEIPTIQELRMLKPDRRWETYDFDSAMELTGAMTAQGGILGTILARTQQFQRWTWRASAAAAGAVVVVGALGGYVGYRLTYKDEGDYRNDDFLVAIESQEIWATFGSQFAHCRQMRRALRALKYEDVSKLPSSFPDTLSRCQRLDEWALLGPIY